MRNTTAHCLLLLALALAPQFVPAQELAPNVLLQSVTLEVIAAMNEEKIQHAGTAMQVAKVVETKVLPLFDFPHMTQIAMAHNWRLATPEQQTALTAEFKTLLVRTYASALSSYRDQVIEFKSLNAKSADTEVTVKSVVRQSGTAPVSIDYDMEKTAAGWKVYDIKVAGVSLVTTYRDTFSEKIRDSGVAGLLKVLEIKNRHGESAARAART